MTEPKMKCGAPILLVRDVVAASRYWCEKVGFQSDGIWGEPPDFAIVKRDATVIMLSKAPPDYEIVPNWRIVNQMWNVYIYTDDADAMYGELTGRGAKIDYEIHDKPYGCREFGIQDLDGHDIAIGQVIN